MDALQPLDLSCWPRRDHWHHFRSRIPCSFAITVELDVTRLTAAIAEQDLRTYPTQIWCIAAVVNTLPAFRMALVEEGDPGLPGTWDVVHPSFTLLNPTTHAFVSVWTRYSDDFALFHAAAQALIDEHRSSRSLFPQGPPPANAFDLSTLPWVSHTAFSLQVQGGQDHLLPIFTLGRYVQRDGRVLLPLSVQISHAAADGFHVGELVTQLQQLVDHPDWMRRGGAADRPAPR